MAMPTHKSATSVTLAPLAEKSAFALFVSKYWLHGLAVFLAAAAWILYTYQTKQAERERRDQSWEAVDAQTELEGFPRIPTASSAAFATLAEQLKGTDAGPWTRWLEANSLVNQRQYEQATAALEQLRKDYPNHPLVAQTWSVDGKSASLVDAWAAGIAARQAWESEHPALFANPAPPADAPKVLMKTDVGDIELTLFPDRAPEHVQNFLDLAASGYYTGTKFFRIDPQMGADGGDPNTLSEDVALWGQGGADKTLSFVDTGLYHFAGALSAASGTGRKESLGSRFSLLTEDRHDFDGQRVVFGTITRGLEIAKQIAAAAQSSDGSGRPEKPVAITAIERLP